MSAPYNLRSTGAPKAGEPQPNVPQTDAPRANAPDNESSPTGQLTVEDLFKRMADDMARLQTVLQSDIKQLQTDIRSDLADHNTRLERLERSHIPTTAVDHPAHATTARAAPHTPPVGNTPSPSAVESKAADTDREPDYELDRPPGWTITDEFDYFLYNRFTNAPGSRRPSEMFVQALFPPLKMQATSENRITPVNVNSKKLSLPRFTIENDIDLHTKLKDCQTELLAQAVNLKDWPSFAAITCEQIHLPIQEWANQKGFRWHHFVFAVINENGLRMYHYNRDTAFVNFEVPVPRVDTPEDIVERLCQVLTFTPAIYKTGNLRAQEFRTNMLRIDHSLDDQLPKTPDILSHQLLITWAYQCKAAARMYWAKQRGLDELLKPLPAPDTPTTISRVASDSAVLDADSYEATEIFRAEATTGKCFNCGKAGHWSRNCTAPKALRAPEPSSRTLRQRREPAATTSRAPVSSRTLTAREPARRPLPLTNRTLKVTKGTLYRMSDGTCYRRLEDGHLAPIPDDVLIEEDDLSDHEVFEVLADESRRDFDVSFDPVVASSE
ncbi:hypothetical protein SEPCBS119000_002233 [Sporothrix epigloea]|uniref:CCHC-type domain-containing protein n=1 Tax=Sporothrix epigloea TaxID=1892477 RepID=A0ABP0DF06_9PEZI